VHVGVRQIFVRFSGCNLSCVYCDTPASRFSHPESCAVQSLPGERQFHGLANPLDVTSVLSAINTLESAAPGHHSVSLTGGEPLEQVEFLARLCPELRSAGIQTYLESNGVLPEALKKLLPYLDVIAMDYKLESASGAMTDVEAHRAFLQIAATKEVFVKTVVTSVTSEEEVRGCADMVAGIGRGIPLVIQPVTPVGEGMWAPSATQLIAFQAAGARLLDDVRVIPQCHKLLGLL
jgi:7-carboxy-7-deazaguanine synthase